MPRTLSADGLFIVLAGLFCLAALRGTLDINPQAVNIDSDLQWYAQILETRAHPEHFGVDTMVPLFKSDPGVPSLLNHVADWLHPTGHAPTNLLYAGNLAVFLHFVMYYLLGRRLFGYPSLATVCSLFMSITVYWAFGTFWGNLHSDPIPRIWFAVFWPLLLLAACASLRRRGLQPLVMLLAGGGICIHTVSALMVGPMLFAGLTLSPEKGLPFSEHCRRCIVNAVCLVAPFAAYLWWLLGDMLEVTSDAALFAQVRELRFAEDFYSLDQGLRDVLLQYSLAQPLLPVGIICWGIAHMQRDRLTPSARALHRLMPGMILGMAGMVGICALEYAAAKALGYNNMSQELLRGTRFLVPLSWLSIVSALSLVWPLLGGWMRGMLATLLLCGLVVFSQDKQTLAARHYLADLTGRQWLETDAARHAVADGRLQLEALEALRRQAKPDELVFSDEDLMAIRYVAHCNMLPGHKDGNIIYYARDSRAARLWLDRQRTLAASDGWLDVWRTCPAQLLLTRKKEYRDALAKTGSVLFENTAWLLVRKKTQN